MDLAKDVLQVAEKVGLVPGLNTASSLVVSIICTVEMARANKLRLRSLTRTISSQLVSISESMQGKWDHAPHELKLRIDEFEAILRDVLNVVTRISKYSRLQALLTAGDCERTITRVEKRLADVQKTITLSICITTAVALNQTRSGVERLVEGAERLRLEIDRGQAEPESRMYTRDDIYLMHKVSSHTIFQSRHNNIPVIVTLCRAKHLSDGRDVLVKKYEGSQAGTTRQTFEKALVMYTKVWDPAVLQFVGGSKSTANISFQVFKAPSGHIEWFWDWARRTVRSNPVETIYGLYNLCTSVKNLREFQATQSLKCSEIIWFGSVINIQPHGNSLQFSLVYTHELEKLETRENFDKVANDNEYFFQSDAGCFMRDMPLPGQEVGSTATLAAAFCDGSKTWLDDVHVLEAMFQDGYENIDPIQLGSILFERGWLGECGSDIPYGGSLRLGDVGYISSEGNFKVVTNIHATFVSENGTHPECVGYIVSDGMEVSDIVFDEEFVVELEDTRPGEARFEYSGKQYKRYVPQPQSASSGWDTTYRMLYVDLDTRMAWRTLQQWASYIITLYDLSIEPHQLQLITMIAEYSAAVIHGPSGVPGIGASQEFSSDINGCPTIYRFEEGEGVRVGDAGAPELDKTIYYSFSPTPDGLGDDSQPDMDILNSDAGAWYEDVRQEARDGYMLINRRSRRVSYLQLPPGVAHSSYIVHRPLNIN